MCSCSVDPESLDKSLFVKVLSLNIYVFSLKKLKFTLSVLIDEVIIEVIQTFGFEEMIA